MASNGQDATSGTATEALRRMAEAEPELAARLMLQSLPAAAADLPAGLSYRLELEDLGAWRVAANGGRAEVTEASAGGELNGDAFAIETDARTLARLAARRQPAPGRGPPPAAPARQAPQGAGAAPPLPGRRARASWRRLGLPVDPDLLYRSLAYAIDPEWTRGHRFRIGYELVGEAAAAGRSPSTTARSAASAALGGEPDAIVRMRYSDWLRLLVGRDHPDRLRCASA